MAISKEMYFYNCVAIFYSAEKKLWFVGVCWKLSLENCQVGGGRRIQIGGCEFS